MIHRFKNNIKEEEIPSLFTYPFCYTPDNLTVYAAQQVITTIKTSPTLQSHLSEGKMFGVLTVKDKEGTLGFLAAFSGQLGGRNTFEYFVPPIYDYLDPNGIFKREEIEISSLNKEIESLLKSKELSSLQDELHELKISTTNTLYQAKQMYKKNKETRATLRQSELTSDQLEALIRESQHEKAEIKRLEKNQNILIQAKQSAIDTILSKIETLKEQRRERSSKLQYWLFEQFKILNAKGECQTLNDIFSNALDKLPPAGAGECAAPKLLQYAYLNELTPISMGEFWWGPSPKNEVRHQGYFYPSCRSKCEPILNFMLQGLNVQSNPLLNNNDLSLEVIYEDKWIIVVNKPSGLLSIPGKESSDSVQTRLQCQNNSDTYPIVAHRLDMSTSGLLILAKDKTTLSALQRQFESRTIKKRYIAILDGIPKQREGTISLPLCLNIDNSPEQIVNHQFGKEAITHYKVIETMGNTSRVEFYPITGRTHQLRVHASHCDGLDCPIKGDSIYGKTDKRLMLHSEMIEFTHPATGNKIRLEKNADF